MWTSRRSQVSGLLDIDDIYGAGAGRYPRLTGCYFPDFALYKISLFAQSQDSSIRLQFAKELSHTAKELGRFASDYLPPLLLSLVTKYSEPRREPDATSSSEATGAGVCSVRASSGHLAWNANCTTGGGADKHADGCTKGERGGSGGNCL
jgi:hypothetical protein